MQPINRDVAQPGSVLAWGARGRWFESSHPDQKPFSFAGRFFYTQTPSSLEGFGYKITYTFFEKNGRVFEQLPPILDHEVIQNKKSNSIIKNQTKFFFELLVFGSQSNLIIPTLLPAIKL